MPKWFSTPDIREAIFKHKNFRSYGNRTLITITAMAVLSLVAIFVFLNMTTKTMEESIRSTLLQSVEQRKLNIEFRLSSVQQAEENMMSMIYPFMDSNSSLERQYEEFMELSSIIGIYAENAGISNIRLYVPQEKFYSHQRIIFHPLENLLNQPDAAFLPYLQKAGRRWQETRPVSIIDSQGLTVSTNMMTYVHSMRQRTDYSKIACVLMLDVDVSDFNEFLSSDVSRELKGYIVNSRGICLATPEESFLGSQVITSGRMEQILLERSGCVKTGDRLYVYQKLNYNDWYIVMDYPASVLAISDNPQANFMQLMVIVVLAVALTMLFILAYNYTMNLTLSQINATLESLNTGKIKSAPEAPQFLDPLHHLEHNTDEIVRTINEFVENRYKDQIAIADSQMKSLQAQIKPHFLYNTLDIIKWMILDNKVDDAIWMVNSLSKYLRKSINKGPSIIPLEEEIEISRSYLLIMQKRFENRFSVNYEIEDSALPYRIPKLTLQPILENALLHGVLYSEKLEKELTIRAWAMEETLFIEVEDNGSGMPEDKRRKLEAGETGYGFTNVRKRLELFSKGNCQCNIFSKEGVGTCIAIQIPAVTQGGSFEDIPPPRKKVAPLTVHFIDKKL